MGVGVGGELKGLGITYCKEGESIRIRGQN